MLETLYYVNFFFFVGLIILIYLCWNINNKIHYIFRHIDIKDKRLKDNLKNFDSSTNLSFDDLFKILDRLEKN